MRIQAPENDPISGNAYTHSTGQALEDFYGEGSWAGAGSGGPSASAL